MEKNVLAIRKMCERALKIFPQNSQKTPKQSTSKHHLRGLLMK